MTVKPSFLSLLSTGYGAALREVDFMSNPTAATDAINQWVNGKTNREIPTLFAPGDLDASTRLVLVNAVFFKGAWAYSFDPSRTMPMPFHLEDGSTVTVPTMSDLIFYGEASGTVGRTAVQVYELQYVGGGLVLDVLVPDSGSLAALEAGLSATSLEALLGSLRFPSSAGSFQIPKFSISTHLALTPILTGMGITDVFMPGVADLSGIDGVHDLFVRTVVQQADIQVDEEGSVAAAATGAPVEELTSCACVVIDRPFLFAIRDRTNGSVLFLGRVLNPSLGSHG
jgi:serpin B